MRVTEIDADSEVIHHARSGVLPREESVCKVGIAQLEQFPFLPRRHPLDAEIVEAEVAGHVEMLAQAGILLGVGDRAVVVIALKQHHPRADVPGSQNARVSNQYRASCLKRPRDIFPYGARATLDIG